MAEGFPEHLQETEPLGASEREHEFPSTHKWPVFPGQGTSRGAGPRGEGTATRGLGKQLPQ